MKPITAKSLLEELICCGSKPKVEAQTLVFDDKPPEHLIPSLEYLHNGVRAILTGQRWMGCSTNTGWGKPIDPNQRIPGWVSCVAVEGDKDWHQLEGKTPELFDDTPEPKPSERGK